MSLFRLPLTPRTLRSAGSPLRQSHHPRPLGVPGGAPFSWPDLIEGDTLRIALRFLKTLGDGEIEIDPPVRRVRASLGRLDARHSDGEWAIRIGNAPPEEGVNAAAPLAHAATAEDTYVARIPGGKLGVISIDPEPGAIFTPDEHHGRPCSWRRP